MSNVNVTVEEIIAIEPHPHAERLEIAVILGTQTIVPKGKFKEGQRVTYFPPDTLLPPGLGDTLGVTPYLKHARWDGEKIQCRVGAARIRGIPSYGFIIGEGGGQDSACLGRDVSEIFGTKQYDPPPSHMPDDVVPEHPLFHRYTEIEHYYQFADAISVDTPVRITEKIHGTNCRVGVVWTDGEWQFVAGSHRSQLKAGRYCGPLELPYVLQLLNGLCDESHNVIVFGELFGRGIQDLDYGVRGDEIGFRVFDISLDGSYLDWDVVQDMCVLHGVATVPVLYKGCYRKGLVDEYTNGRTMLSSPGSITSKFKGREGIVITPLKEEWSEVLLGRLILKSKSADFIDRRGAKDNA